MTSATSVPFRRALHLAPPDIRRSVILMTIRLAMALGYDAFPAG